MHIDLVCAYTLNSRLTGTQKLIKVVHTHKSTIDEVTETSGKEGVISG